MSGLDLKIRSSDEAFRSAEFRRAEPDRTLGVYHLRCGGCIKMGPRKTPMLSKSRFLAGRQCSLRLWHQCYNPDLASEVSPAQQAIFDTGHEVGKLATHLYPAGFPIKEDYLHRSKAERNSLSDSEISSTKNWYKSGIR